VERLHKKRKERSAVTESMTTELKIVETFGKTTVVETDREDGGTEWGSRCHEAVCHSSPGQVIGQMFLSFDTKAKAEEFARAHAKMYHDWKETESAQKQ
jgi:hypothetical protein